MACSDDLVEGYVVVGPFQCLIQQLALIHRHQRVTFSVEHQERFARAISNDITAVYVELDASEGDEVREKWNRWWPDIPLVIVPSPYRSILQPLMDFLDETDREHNDGQLATVILPEFVPAKWWQGLLHNQTAFLLKAALLYSRGQPGLQRVIIDVPYHLRK